MVTVESTACMTAIRMKVISKLLIFSSVKSFDLLVFSLTVKVTSPTAIKINTVTLNSTIMVVSILENYRER